MFCVSLCILSVSSVKSVINTGKMDEDGYNAGSKKSIIRKQRGKVMALPDKEEWRASLGYVLHCPIFRNCV